MFQYNKFTKSPTSKTGYNLLEGFEPIFDKSVYLIVPRYVHGRSPAFSLVAKGKHISGLYPTGPALFGDHGKCALIIFIRENGIDLFQTDLDPITARAMLCSGQLNDQLFEAREKTKHNQTLTTRL